MTDDSVAAEFDDLASWCEGSSALYERLCRLAAADDFLLDVAADHTPGQPAPQLLLAAIQAELFASDADDDGDDGGAGDGDVTAATAALAAYYPSVVDDPRPPDDDLADAVRAFVREREATIRDLVSTRRVQTNSVRRCSALYPGFATVADRVEAPFAVLSVGASAGLNLNWDRYRYRYRRECLDGVDAAETALTAGDPNSPVTIESSLRGPGTPPLPDDSPAVASERDAPTFHLAGERPDPDRENGIQLRLERVDGSDPAEPTSEHLGTFEQHGAWLAWQDSSDGTDAADGPSVVHEEP